MRSPQSLPRRKIPKPQVKRFDPRAFLSHTGIGRTVGHYGPKELIYSQGEPADAVFYIQRGKVRLSVLSKRGKEATIALLAAGNFLGEECITTDQPTRVVIATTVTEAAVSRIERKEMLRALHAEHALSDLFIAYLIQRHNRTQAAWWINYSIQAKSVWRERFCCSPDLGKTVPPKKSFPVSARRLSRKWLAQPARE